MKPQLHDHVYSLLELVTAVIVICLVIVGIVAVGRHVQSRTRIQLTRDVIAILEEAAAGYSRRTGSQPAAAAWRASDPPEVHAAAFLAAVVAVDKDLLADVPAFMIREVRDPQHPAAPAMRVVCDGWGNPIDYELRRSAADTLGQPLFRSAGPNGRYDDEGTNHDNIRSDRS